MMAMILAVLSTPAPRPTPAVGGGVVGGGGPGGGEMPEIKDIAPPFDLFGYPTWMMVVAGGVILAVIGLMIWMVVRWMKRRPAVMPPSPREVALGALERLQGEAGVALPYTFSFAVSDVLRTYIGGQFGLHAREQTSPEFLGEIVQTGRFSDGDRRLIGEFLVRCDMIKFARAEAGVEDNVRLLGSATLFVKGEVE